jgi:hypothetical protein
MVFESWSVNEVLKRGHYPLHLVVWQLTVGGETGMLHALYATSPIKPIPDQCL